MDKSSFANSIIFGQGHSKNLKRFSEMTDAEKKDTMERSLNLEVFSRAHNLVKSKINERDLNVYSLDQNFESLSGKLSKLNVELLDANEELEGFGESVRANLRILEEAVSDRLAEIALLESKINNFPEFGSSQPGCSK